MKDKLHIVFVDFDDIKNPLLAGGQALATYEIAKRLIKRGNRVTVICSRFPGSKEGKNAGIFYKHIGLGSDNIKANNLAFFFALPFALRSLSADVVIECFTAPISTCFSPLYTNIPVIGMPTMFEAEEFAKKYHVPFHWIERFGSRFYKYFLAYSPINKQKMERLNPKIYTRIIPNGVSEKMFSVKEKDKGYGLFIGRIDIRQKGLDLLLKAWFELIKKKKYKLIIAGNGPKSDEEKLASLIQKYNLSEYVSFVGRVNGKKKESLIANASFGVYPSRFEDFPLVPLEFTGMNKPLVCFDIKGLKWVDARVSAKARPFHVVSLMKNLKKLMNKQVRIAMKKQCRPFARQYGWNMIAKQYEAFCYYVVLLERQKKGFTL